MYEKKNENSNIDIAGVVFIRKVPAVIINIENYYLCVLT